MQRTCLLLWAALLGCGAPPGQALDAGVPDAAAGPATALFEVPRPGQPPPSGFYALPFPNDIRVTEEGGIDLSDHARPNVIIDEYLDVIGERQRGFGLSAAAFFRFDGEIDADSLPQSVEESVVPGASVYLVNVDKSSPGYAMRRPLRYRFEHFAGEAIGENWLSVLPYPGFPMREGTTYAVVVTSRVAAADGSPVARSPDMEVLLGDGEPFESALVRPYELYAPLRDFLDRPGGDERDDVASAAVFTTQEATSLLREVREVVWSSVPKPNPRDIRWLKTTDDFVWFDGIYNGPNFQAGEVPYTKMKDGGDIRLDPETGKPVLQRMEELRFSFTVPPGQMPPKGWPVVIYAHGTGGDYHSYYDGGIGRRLAKRGLATISIDQVLHGPRNPNSSPVISFFNFQNPLAVRDNALQGAIDDFQLARMVASFRYTERHAGGRTVRFDPERIYFFGHSQGGLTGVPFVASEPLVKGAVMSGAGGLLYLSLLHKTEPLDVNSLVRAFIRDQPLDEFNPILALIQMWVERSDSAAYAPLLIDRPAPGNTPKNIFLSLGLTDRYTPVPSIKALATATGLDQVGPVLDPVPGLELAGASFLDPPVSQNRNGVTGALLQYEERPGSDGHFVVFNIPAAQKQSTEFLGTLADDGAATIVAP